MDNKEHLKPHQIELLEFLEGAQPFDTFEIAVEKSGWAVVKGSKKKKVIHFDKGFALQKKAGYYVDK